MKKLMLICFLLAGCGKKETPNQGFSLGIEDQGHCLWLMGEDGFFRIVNNGSCMEWTPKHQEEFRKSHPEAEQQGEIMVYQGAAPHKETTGIFGHGEWADISGSTAPHKEIPICGSHWKSKDERGRDVFHYIEGPCPENMAPHKKTSNVGGVSFKYGGRWIKAPESSDIQPEYWPSHLDSVTGCQENEVARRIVVMGLHGVDFMATCYKGMWIQIDEKESSR